MVNDLSPEAPYYTTSLPEIVDSRANRHFYSAYIYLNEYMPTKITAAVADGRSVKIRITGLINLKKKPKDLQIPIHETTRFQNITISVPELSENNHVLFTSNKEFIVKSGSLSNKSATRATATRNNELYYMDNV